MAHLCWLQVSWRPSWVSGNRPTVMCAKTENSPAINFNIPVQYSISIFLSSSPIQWLVHSSKVTFTCVREVSFMHFRRVSHVFWTHSGCISVWQKRGMALTYVLLQLYCEVLHLHRCISCTFRMRLVHVPDASCMYFRRIQMLPWSLAVLYRNEHQFYVTSSCEGMILSCYVAILENLWILSFTSGGS